jgi:hypothetical protein
MSVATDTWYSPRRYSRARLVILVLALLGLMTFTAVQELAGQCRTGPQYLLTDSGAYLLTDKGAFLVTDKKITRCELTGWGWLRIALSEQTADILRRFGIPFSYI